MSRHNIVGSEAFQRAPFVYIRNVGRGRRKSPASIAVTAAAGLGALAATGFLALAAIQAMGVSY